MKKYPIQAFCILLYAVITAKQG